MTEFADVTSRATTLAELHSEERLLTLVNVWDVASARAVAGAPGTTALATASHAIAASLGYPDGEVIPVDLMLDMVGRIARATDLPVTADLEAGYGDPGETVRRAIGLGVVGANIEDQLRPLAESVARVEAVILAAAAEGLPGFVLNARTDAVLLAGDRPRDSVLADAIARGRAYVAAGAPCVFVPGLLSEAEITELVGAFGPRRLSVLGLPGMPLPSRMEALGVSRASYGPLPQRVALTALQELTESLLAGGEVPSSMRTLT